MLSVEKFKEFNYFFFLFIFTPFLKMDCFHLIFSFRLCSVECASMICLVRSHAECARVYYIRVTLVSLKIEL